MKLKIPKVVINLVRSQAVAMVLCLLMWMEALCTAPTDRLWRDFGANMTHVFGGNFTEITVTSIIVCASLAARSPLANLACHKSSRCVFASVYLPRVGGEQTEGFTCWYSQVCSHKGELLTENETVTVADPICPGTQTLTCKKQGMMFQDALPAHAPCTASFTQHAFGCMYDSYYQGTYCEARQHCEWLGANLASPETAKDTADMMAYYATKYAGKPSFHVGLVNSDGVWRWAANQREADPPRKGSWDPGQPNGDGKTCIMWSHPSGYKFNDAPNYWPGRALCHVWGIY